MFQKKFDNYFIERNFSDLGNQKNEEKAVFGTAYFSALFSGCFLMLRMTGGPACFIVGHKENEICIAYCNAKYLAKEKGMYYTIKEK